MKVLFFAPHAGVWAHAFPEALVGEALRASGADIRYVSCDGAFSSFCVTMAAHGVAQESSVEDKERVCAQCRHNRDWIRRGFAFDGCDFDSVLDGADEARIEALLDAAPRRDLTRFEVDGVPIGRLAVYEYLIQKKKTQAAFSDEEWAGFRPRLGNALRSLFAAQRILDREKPDRVLIYNTLYSVNAAWRAAAEQRGIAVYFLHGGPNLERRLQTLMIGRDTTLGWYARALEAWARHRDVPCNRAELAQVTDHFRQLFRGTSVFAYSAAKSSSAEDLRSRFAVRREQKLCVASLSSYDEYVAARMAGELPDESTLLFPTQLDWVRALVEWFRARPDLFLLIRVHPREFPNKREGVKSEHAQLLEQELSSLPDNVRVNWPADRLSIYAIAEEADVFLNAWSSAGKEMALLGLPVVVYCPSLLLYPGDLNLVGDTRERYFAAIDEALREGWSFERIRRAYRWCVLEQVRAVVDIGDGFDISEAPAERFWERARNALFAVPGLRQARDLARRPKMLREQQRIADLILGGATSLLELPPASVDEAEETAALRDELRRLIDALYPPGVARGPLHVRLKACAER
jgi:hypothetical protein